MKNTNSNTELGNPTWRAALSAIQKLLNLSGRRVRGGAVLRVTLPSFPVVPGLLGVRATLEIAGTTPPRR